MFLEGSGICIFLRIVITCCWVLWDCVNISIWSKIFSVGFCLFMESLLLFLWRSVGVFIVCSKYGFSRSLLVLFSFKSSMSVDEVYFSKSWTESDFSLS